MDEVTELRHDWLLDHPEEEALYAGEFIAIADGKVVAHGKICAEVLEEARKLGYDAVLARAHGEQPEILSVIPSSSRFHRFRLRASDFRLPVLQ